MKSNSHIFVGRPCGTGDDSPIYTVGWLAENNAQTGQTRFSPIGSELVPISVQAFAHVGLTKIGPN